MKEQKTTYEYDAAKQDLTRVTEVELHKEGKPGEPTRMGTRTYRDVFEGKVGRDAQVNMLKAETEKAKQAVDQLKKQMEKMVSSEDIDNKEVKAWLELAKKAQQLEQVTKAKDQLDQTERQLARLRDELAKVKAIVPEFDRIK